MSRLSRGNWRKMSDASAAEAKLMYEGGMSIAQVADRFGVSRQSMHGTLKRLGTKFRSRLRYGSANHFYRGGSKAKKPAQAKVDKAVRTGRMTRPETCEMCGESPPPMKDGRSRIQGHHEDYTKPMEVQWLCQPCHHRVHMESA